MQGSASPLLFGQDLVKVPASRFEPATFALAILKARIPEPPRRSTPSPRLQFHSRRSRGPIHRSSIPHRRNTNLWVQRGSKTFCFCCSCGAAARSVHRHGLHAVRPWTTATRSHLERYPHRADGPESLRGCSTCSNARQVTGRVDLPRRFKAWAGFELATVAAFAESWRARRNQGNCSVHRRLNQRTPQVRILNVIRVVREDLAAFIVARPEHG